MSYVISVSSDWLIPYEGVDVHWSTLVVIMFPEVNVKKRGNKVIKDDLTESSVLNDFSMVNPLEASA